MLQATKIDKRSSIFIIFKSQIRSVLVHLINLISNILGNDVASCIIRKKLLTMLGAKLGSGTVIRGGGYLYGSGLVAGSGCLINRDCYFDVTETVFLENNVVVGHGVTFITAEHKIGSAEKRAGKAFGKSIIVKHGAWIGANVTILPGITIGAGSIVGAGSVVTKNIADNSVVVGIPAKKIKELES